MVQHYASDNNTLDQEELKKKEKRLYEFESVDSCTQINTPGLKEASADWKYKKWMTEFKTNNKLDKFLRNKLFDVSKLLTCAKYYHEY